MATEVFKAREVFTRQRLKIKPPKPKSWSHDDELAAAKGKKIRLLVTSEEHNVTSIRYGLAWEGLLLEADRFAIKLARSDQSTLIVFKHIIRSFEVLE